ncbi:MAG: trehalose 6-phosphate phosphatase [Alphaproteobacteria bacterium]|nr:trehalose 6-phosphate phosphatase [Alphaproteobacteria bacterium]
MADASGASPLPGIGIVQLDSLDIRQVAILLDIDGTLLDIAPTPHDVRVPTTLRRTLAKLQTSTDGALALVSGRSLRDIDLLFSPLLLSAVGGHGAEIRLLPDGPGHQQQALPLDNKLRRRFAAIAEPGDGIIVEDKGYSLALHYRLAPEKQRAIEDAVAAICADLPMAFVEVLPGKAVLEIKKVGFNKGSAIQYLMSHPPFAGRRPIFVGDDKTDDAAFAVLPEFDGIAISVGRMVPGVTQRFETPTDVRRWLERLTKDDKVPS